MDMSRISALEKHVSQYPDNKEAWERVCDLLKEPHLIETQDVDDCEAAKDYLTNIYPVAVRAAEIVHVMSTVPIYILIRKTEQADMRVIIGKEDPEEGEKNLLPIFFSQEIAEKAQRDIAKATEDDIQCARIPFMLLVDDELGVFKDSQKHLYQMVLCDLREGKALMRIDTKEVIMLIFTASRALRSYYDIDLFDMSLSVNQIVSELKQEMERQLDYPEQTPGKSKLPVS